MTVNAEGFRQPLDTEAGVERVHATGLEVMITRQDVQRDSQPVHRRPHQLELCLGAVVGVVARQHGKTDAATEVTIGDIDECLEVAIVLLTLPRDMPVAEMYPAQDGPCP